MKKTKLAQISTEYLIIVGFVTFVVIGILAVAFFYSGMIKDKLKITQVNNYANKIISTAESVFYHGEPSKATISAYLPDNIKDIEILDNSLVISIQLSSGLNRIAFSSNVPIVENVAAPLTHYQGTKNIEVVANSTDAIIAQV